MAKRIMEIQEIISNKKTAYTDGEYLAIMDGLKAVYDVLPKEPPEPQEPSEPVCTCDGIHFDNYEQIEENIAALDLSAYHSDPLYGLKLLMRRLRVCDTRNCRENRIYEVYCYLVKRDIHIVHKHETFMKAAINQLDVLRPNCTGDWTVKMKEKLLQ